VNVLVDTAVWSLALRRQRTASNEIVTELVKLIRDGRVLMLGAIRQEILSGIRSAPQFEMLRERLRDFPDLELDAADYEEGAACFNRCRSRGIQGSNTDFLMCSVALRYDVPIFTTDKDFSNYGPILGVRLHALGE
jgi:predicted nucleic acid-binding protein